MKFDAIVIGSSAGGLAALSTILPALPASFPIPIIVVQHRSKEAQTLLEEVLSQKCKITIKQADEKEPILAGTVYFAPGDYHLLIEQDRTFSLSFDPPVNFSRPSIDILFETAAAAYKKRLLAIILTGANHDGARGIKMVRVAGGTTIAEDPETAQTAFMPRAAINTGYINHVLTIDKIRDFLVGLGDR